MRDRPPGARALNRPPLRSLADLTRMLKRNPELMNLRLLEAASGGKGGATLVLGRKSFAASPGTIPDEKA